MRTWRETEHEGLWVQGPQASPASCLPQRARIKNFSCSEGSPSWPGACHWPDWFPHKSSTERPRPLYPAAWVTQPDVDGCCLMMDDRQS